MNTSGTVSPSFTVKDILNMEVAPALGCTEPVAVALAVAAASSLFNRDMIESVEVWVDPNIYKNGYAVSIPGARGGHGLELAAALGLFGGDPLLRLEVLEPVDDTILEKARAFVEEKRVSINLLKEKHSIFVQTRVADGTDSAEAVIEEVHDNITILKKNGKSVLSHPLLNGTEESRVNISALENWLRERSLEELIAMVEELDEEDFRFIQEGIDVNVHLADYGLIRGPGLAVGATFNRLVCEGLLKKDLILSARILTSSAADARMSGVKMPAMSSAGSGNHGLTAILPILAVHDFLSLDDQQVLLKAIALSHVVTGYIKAHTGRLSAICGCSVAAGAGAAAGITFCMGGGPVHVSGAIKNLISDLAGVICDGAKGGCALKLATAAGTAVQSALFALHGIDVKATDGIVGLTPEQTMKNVGELGAVGMIEVDRTILDIMLKKQFHI